MATDLFGEYYNNPTKSYIYANLLCNGASADEISFDITKDAGVISDNANTLASLDFSDVHVPLTQYTKDMKVINPYGLIYVKGIAQGDSYMTKAFGMVSEKTLGLEDWMYRTTAILHLKYVNEQGARVLKCITASGDDNFTFLENLQSLLDKNKIPITAEYKDDRYLYLTSTVLGYEFWLIDIELLVHLIDEDDSADDSTETIAGVENNLGFGYDDGWSVPQSPFNSVDRANAYSTDMNESDYRKIYDILGSNAISDENSNGTTDYIRENIDTDTLYNEYLFEDLTKYVPAHKYRNGAMKGCVVVATYPVFNADNIPDTQRSLRIGHLKDRIEDYYTSDENAFIGFPMYAHILRDVVDSYFSQYEYDIYTKWSNAYTYMNTGDGWIQPEEIPMIPQNYKDSDDAWSHSHVPNYYVLNSLYKDAVKYEAVGLYGYATYLSKTNGWMTMGQLYARTAVEDDESKNTHNLIPSFIIYNPNSFPVTVNYMTFA